MGKALWECETEAERVKEIQKLINNGKAWTLEGSIGREAMEYLRAGLCELGKVSFRDYYGNRVPSRYEVKAGTCGAPLSTRGKP